MLRLKNLKVIRKLSLPLAFMIMLAVGAGTYIIRMETVNRLIRKKKSVLKPDATVGREAAVEELLGLFNTNDIPREHNKSFPSNPPPSSNL